VVSSQISLNNLRDVDSAHGVISMDFFYKLEWVDNRLYMPDFWAKIGDKIKLQGIEFTRIANAKNGIWVPDINFLDAVEYTEVSTEIRLFPDMAVIWSRHISITLQQPLLHYALYPLDSHEIQIRVESFGLDSALLQIGYLNPAVKLQMNEDVANFNMSDTWTYNGFIPYIIYILIVELVSPATYISNEQVQRESSKEYFSFRRWSSTI